MRWWRCLRNPYVKLCADVAFACGNMALGLFSLSWWFITAGAYYAVLAVARFALLLIRRRAKGDYTAETFAKRITGILLLVVSVCIAGINVLSIVHGYGSAYPEVVMIAIAAFTCVKIVVAVVEMVRARRHPSPVEQTLRNLSLATACVSVYSLQRSMLMSFPGMTAAEIRIFNGLTGTAVWLMVLLLGINLIEEKHVLMAKSKIVKATNKVAQVVTDGYKKIEKSVVGGYTKIEDRFVDRYLTRDGETVEEAKARLKSERNY